MNRIAIYRLSKIFDQLTIRDYGDDPGLVDSINWLSAYIDTLDKQQRKQRRNFNAAMRRRRAYNDQRHGCHDNS